MSPGQTYEDLGLNLEAGSQHDRPFIGPAQDYDLVSAMSFGLLTTRYRLWLSAHWPSADPLSEQGELRRH
jgi:hypothetical protein